MNGKFVNIWIIISVFYFYFLFLYSFSLLSFLFMTFILALSLSHRLSFFLSPSPQLFMVWWRWRCWLVFVVVVLGFSSNISSLSLILLVFVVFGAGGGFPQNISFGSLSFCGFWFLWVWACDFVVLCVCGCSVVDFLHKETKEWERWEGRERKMNK